MIREDYIELKELATQMIRLLDRVKIVGCGLYFKKQDRCGHRYNWKSLNGFKMELWLCDKCKNKIAKEMKE